MSIYMLSFSWSYNNFKSGGVGVKMIHIQDETRTRLVRWYNTGSYVERSKYDAVCTLIHVNSTTVVIEGLCGNNISTKFWKELRNELVRQGYTTALVERHGKWKTIMKSNKE